MSTLLSFLVTLAILIVVHEYGHYRMAVACKVKVLRFSVGFGRVIWRRHLGPDQCEFALSMLPLGGYVKMLDEREAPVDPADVDRAFNRRPLWQRSAIVVAGPLANLILAVVLYTGLFWVGTQEPKALLARPPVGSPAAVAGLGAGDWVQSWAVEGQEPEPILSLTDLSWRLAQLSSDQHSVDLWVSDRDGRGTRRMTLKFESPRSTDMDVNRAAKLGLAVPFSDPVLGDVRADGPAFKAGLKAGDRVLRVDGATVVDAHSLRERIRAFRPEVGEQKVMAWDIERQGQVISLEVTPRIHQEGSSAPVGRIDAFVGLPPQMVTVQRGPWDGLVQGAHRTWDISWMSLKMLGKMLIGEASLKNLSGPLTIADYAGQSAQNGLLSYLSFLALISVSLGILNLLPLPMLDGGHLMYHLFEWLTGRPVPEVWLDRLQRGGVVVLVLLMSVALFNDVVRLLGL